MRTANIAVSPSQTRRCDCAPSHGGGILPALGVVPFPVQAGDCGLSARHGAHGALPARRRGHPRRRGSLRHAAQSQPPRAPDIFALLGIANQAVYWASAMSASAARRRGSLHSTSAPIRC
jgi:hypothetical protein